MQASGPYRYTASFDNAFKHGFIDDNVLFFSQPIVMRGKCPSKIINSTECQGLKDLVVGGEIITFNLTTTHYASE